MRRAKLRSAAAGCDAVKDDHELAVVDALTDVKILHARAVDDDLSERRASQRSIANSCQSFQGSTQRSLATIRGTPAARAAARP